MEVHLICQRAGFLYQKGWSQRSSTLYAARRMSIKWNCIYEIFDVASLGIFGQDSSRYKLYSFFFFWEQSAQPLMQAQPDGRPLHLIGEGRDYARRRGVQC